MSTFKSNENINWFRCYHTDMWQQAQAIVSLVLIGLLVFMN